MAVKQKKSEVIDYEPWGFYMILCLHYFITLFPFSFLFCNEYEVFHYLPGLNLYCLSCLCFKFVLCIFVHFWHRLATHAESINSDLQRGQTSTTHTTLNTEQNQLAIKVSADN